MHIQSFLHFRNSDALSWIILCHVCPGHCMLVGTFLASVHKNISSIQVSCNNQNASKY